MSDAKFTRRITTWQNAAKFRGSSMKTKILKSEWCTDNNGASVLATYWDDGQELLAKPPYRPSNWWNNPTRTLLLGESYYPWTKDDGKVVVHPSAHHNEDVVAWIKDDFAGEGQPFMRCLTRAITNKEWPTKDEVNAAWDCFAFTNYVPGLVDIGCRPNSQHWEQARS
jgi:hypothetical protein